MEGERQFPEATGALSNILYDLALAAKMITREVRRAGLADIMGQTGAVNVHGDQVKKLDEFADDVIFRALDHCGHLCVMASEESEGILEIPAKFRTGNYSLLYDPLDGSSNIDANVSIGTIFGVFRRTDVTAAPGPADWLRPGSELVAAGYLLYSTSTMLVYSTGDGVHAFTLDPEVGEFLLTWSDLHFPETPSYYSFNLAASAHWERGVERFVAWAHHDDTPDLSHRYIGSAVADFHRNLLHGGIFAYPGTDDEPAGKLRLLYEAAPLAFLAQHAGGRGSDGRTSLLDIVPTSIHQRTPVFVGARDLVERLEAFVSETQPDA
jgi:fructose-1,6-bisphosphatase I